MDFHAGLAGLDAGLGGRSLRMLAKARGVRGAISLSVQRGILRSGQAGPGREVRRAMRLAAIAFLAVGATVANSQSCLTQAKMSAELYEALSGQALQIATDVKSGDSAKVQAATVSDLASNFAATAYLVTSTAPRLSGDTLRVTQVYQLDASKRAAGDTSDAEFTCPLTGTTSETDFSIAGLPSGVYGFAMVEAQGGERPWLISMLLRKEVNGWKMAGLYTHARTAAGHDGTWYWRAARDHAKAKQVWLAWLLYGEADSLLRPANFVSSTNLDGLLGEQRDSLPPELSDGLGPETPMVVKGSDGAEFRFTSIAAEGSEDGQRLNLMLHIKADPVSDPTLARARNTAAAKSLLDAHKELRAGFDGVCVFADSDGNAPFATEQKISEIP